MPASSKWARGQVTGRRFSAPDDVPKRRWKQLSEEEVAFVVAKLEAGLTNAEIMRMFFRKFGRDITNGCVKWHRQRHVSGSP